MAKRVLNFAVTVDKTKAGYVVKTVTPKLFGEQEITSEAVETFEQAKAVIEVQLLELTKLLDS